MRERERIKFSQHSADRQSKRICHFRQLVSLSLSPSQPSPEPYRSSFYCNQIQFIFVPFLFSTAIVFLSGKNSLALFFCFVLYIEYVRIIMQIWFGPPGFFPAPQYPILQPKKKFQICTKKRIRASLTSSTTSNLPSSSFHY